MISADTNVMKAAQDQRHVALCAAESLGYFGLAHGALQPPDRNHLFKGQELLEESDAADVNGVFLVEPVVSPFEIVGRAIRFYSVHVIDHRKFGRIWDEGYRDESMDIDGLSLPTSEEPDLWIPDLIHTRSENFSVASPRPAPLPMANTIQASHTSEIAYFVKTIEVNNASPLFISHHLMGPCERSAHSIVVSSTTQGGPACLFH